GRPDDRTAEPGAHSRQRHGGVGSGICGSDRRGSGNGHPLRRDFTRGRDPHPRVRAGTTTDVLRRESRDRRTGRVSVEVVYAAVMGGKLPRLAVQVLSIATATAFASPLAAATSRVALVHAPNPTPLEQRTLTRLRGELSAAGFEVTDTVRRT